MNVIQKWNKAERLLMPHPAGHQRIPMVDGAENHQERRHAHHHMKVGDHEQ